MTLELVRAILAEHKDRAAFMRMVARYYPPDDSGYRKIAKAYEVAKAAFRGETREGGERFFEHLRCVALIVMVHLRIRDADTIVAALLHDIVEDIESWTHERVRAEFGENVARYVWYVTKPSIEEFDGRKRARDRRYRGNLMHAPREAIIIKLADRLHNLLTQWDTSEEKRRRKIQETEYFYLLLAGQKGILIHELEAILSELGNGE